MTDSLATGENETAEEYKKQRRKKGRKREKMYS